MIYFQKYRLLENHKKRFKIVCTAFLDARNIKGDYERGFNTLDVTDMNNKIITSTLYHGSCWRLTTAWNRILLCEFIILSSFAMFLRLLNHDNHYMTRFIMRPTHTSKQHIHPM